jgi:hypothetical protein
LRRLRPGEGDDFRRNAARSGFTLHANAVASSDFRRQLRQTVTRCQDGFNRRPALGIVNIFDRRPETIIENMQ